LVVGAAAAFAVSFNESMVTLFLSTPTTETLPAMIWPQLRYSPSPLVAVSSVFSVIIALGVASGFVFASRFAGQNKRYTRT
jgi:ABC-type spermidine/putrescine transport system permease subunit II